MSLRPSPPHEVVKKRWLGFLIWQAIASAFVYLIISPLFSFHARFSASGVLSFLSFNLSLFLFSLSLFFLSSPCSDPSTSFSDLALGFLKACLRLVIGGITGVYYSPDFFHRARRPLSKFLFLLICVISGLMSTTAMCGRAEHGHGMRLVGLGINGAMFGLVYGSHYLFHERWILKFPIIQRPFFYSFKMGLSSSLKQALKLSTLAFASSLLVTPFLGDNLKCWRSIGTFILYLVNVYAGISVISFTWELSTHLLMVVHSRRCCFAPSRGSAAAETNPSEVLLEALEQSTPRSILKHLAYLDLCMISENNVESWRRAAFFEGTGDTYRRVISLCLRPLEHLTTMLVEGLEGLSTDKADLFSQQMNLSTGKDNNSKLQTAFNDYQLYFWSARAAASLTSCSHSEDRYGVAQLTGSNVAVVSTLLSALIAVEACLGKKTSSQSADFMGPSSIRWATPSTARRLDGAISVSIRRKRCAGLLHARAYAMADILRTSIYQIVFAFQTDMEIASKSSALEKNWVAPGKPLYGTREALILKLHQFLVYRAF